MGNQLKLKEIDHCVSYEIFQWKRGGIMKRTFLLLIVVFVVFMLASCATASSEPKVSDNWWDNPPADTSDIHYEVGYAKGSTLQISRDWAKANANTALAQYVSNSIDTIVTTYVNDAGEVSQQANNMQALQAFESVSKQRAQATLTGVTYIFQSMSDGGVYVLASLPIGPLAEELKATVTESFVKNKAAEEANRMMNDAIDKYFR